MQIVIEDNATVRLAQVFHNHEELIVKRFSVRDPRAYFSKAMKTGHWDGYIRRYQKSSQSLSKAFLKDLIDLCNENDIPYEIRDLRPKSHYPPPAEGSYDKNILGNITLEDYQLRVIQTVCKNDIAHEIGVVDATTGSGKTEMFAAIVKLFRCPTVIITEQIIVLEQIVQRLQLRNVVHNNDIGLFCSGRMPDNNLVIVGSVQSLQTPTKPKKDNFNPKPETLVKEFIKLLESDREALKKIIGEINLNQYEKTKELSDDAALIFKAYLVNIYYTNALKGYYTLCSKSDVIQQIISRCELLIVDEVDRASSDLYIDLFKCFKGRYRYGFSGTPFDPGRPVQNLILKERFGTALVKINRSEVEAAGRIQPVVYYMIQHGKIAPNDMTAYDIAEREQIIEDTTLHQKIKTIIENRPDEGYLILVDTANVEILGLKLQQFIPNSIFLYNKTPAKKRNEALRAFEKREIKVLIGSKILKRGLDLKGGTENLILLGGGKQWANLDQIVGRSVRLTNKGESKIFDFYYTGNSYLLTHSRRHLKWVNEMGYKTFIIVNGKLIDGREFVRKRYRII